MLDSTRTRTARVIGVVSDRLSVRGSLRGMQADPERALYFAAGQTVLLDSDLLVRPHPGADPRGVVRQQVQAIDPDQSIVRSNTLENEQEGHLAGVRVFAAVFGVLSGCALLLALIGMHGVIACTTEQRRAEIGLRMALGATAADIKRQIVGYGLRTSVFGVALGILAGFGLSQLVRIFLFGVTTLVRSAL